MYLQQILNGLCYKTIGKGNPNVEHLSFSTTDVKPNTLFFCLKGKRFDGHDFFAKAVCDGAVAIVTEKPLDSKVLQIVVENSRVAMAVASKNFFDRCVEKMQVVSVVGTNGKTSTTYVLDAILQKAGFNTAVVGTNGIFFNGQKHASQLTTPDPICLHSWFKQMYLCKVKVVIMEVSAHAIALNKMNGITSDFAIFTNFSQDHLDFFGTMEQYKKAKASFFCSQFVNNCVVNVDDVLGREISQNFPCTVGYSCKQSDDCFATDIQLHQNGSNFLMHLFGKTLPVSTRLRGAFNVYNILASASCANAMGVDIQTIVEGVESVECIDGRNQTFVRNDGARVVVDFAHTPDGVENILNYLKSTTQGNLIVVFGCGGNRDKFKRPVMGRVVSKYANFAVVTNDNPRYEDPAEIAKEVCSGVTCDCKILLNRSQATAFALSIAQPLDTVAVLGKGSECYQEIKGRKFPYSDVDIVGKLIFQTST